MKKAAGGSVTWLATALATFRAEGTGDQAMRDLPLIDDALETTEGMLELLTGIVSTLVVHRERMRKALAGCWCTASNLADVIVRKTGLSFRQVHHVIARLVRICVQENFSPSAVTVELLNRAAQETIRKTIAIDEPTIRNALDPEVFIRTRVTVGSVSPAEVNRMLEVARTNLADSGAWLAAERARLAERPPSSMPPYTPLSPPKPARSIRNVVYVASRTRNFRPHEMMRYSASRICTSIF